MNSRIRVSEQGVTNNISLLLRDVVVYWEYVGKMTVLIEDSVVPKTGIWVMSGQHIAVLVVNYGISNTIVLEIL